MICIFAGPTFAGALPALPPHAVLLPPVAQGDVYRAAAQRPWAIAIIDGFFDRQPAVTHKEILWAMSEGVHVLGAASMGALRAAELETFGMEGVGAIFADYRDGVLEDDDEVAVSHGMAEDGFRPASEAMVNIRATLDAAVRAEVMTAAESASLAAIAKSLFYAYRHYAAILECAQERGFSRARIAVFRNWFASARVDQKRTDALELLAILADRFPARPAPKRVSFKLNQTEMWDFAMRQTPFLDGRAESEPLIDELRLLGPEMYRQVWDGALLRALANRDAARQEAVLSPNDIEEARRTVERRNGAPAEMNVRNDEVYREGAVSEARLGLVRKLRRAETAGQIESEMLARGTFEQLAARANRKRQALEALGAYESDLASARTSADELLAWYFQRSGQSVPQDLAGYAAGLDLPGIDMLFRLMLREYIFAREQNGEGTGH